jgi:hypothetical protein
MLHHSSSLGHGNTLDAPAANASYFNVGRLNSTLKETQGRIDALETEVEAAKKP